MLSNIEIVRILCDLISHKVSCQFLVSIFYILLSLSWCLLVLVLACPGVCLSWCLSVSNKRKSDKTDRAQFFVGPHMTPRNKIREIFVCFCFTMYTKKKEKIFTIEIEDGREAP